jgi:hypothetical protein
MLVASPRAMRGAPLSGENPVTGLDYGALPRPPLGGPWAAGLFSLPGRANSMATCGRCSARRSTVRYDNGDRPIQLGGQGAPQPIDG